MNVADIRTAPPITAGWLASIFIVSGMVSLGIIDEHKLMFDPFRISQRPWTLFTGFINFGRLNVGLLFLLSTLANSCGGVERASQMELACLPPSITRRLTPNQKASLERKFFVYRTFDFAYFLAQICAVLVCFSVFYCQYIKKFLPNISYLSVMLSDIVQYMHCRIFPDEPLLLFIIGISRRYSWWLYMLQKYITRSEFFVTCDLFKNAGIKAGLNAMYKSEWIFLFFVRLLMGQMWWVIRFFTLGHIYNNQESEAAQSWDKAYLKYQSTNALKNSMLEMPRVVLLLLVVPPWYYFIINNILRQEDE